MNNQGCFITGNQKRYSPNKCLLTLGGIIFVVSWLSPCLFSPGRLSKFMGSAFSFDFPLNHGLGLASLLLTYQYCKNHLYSGIDCPQVFQNSLSQWFVVIAGLQILGTLILEVLPEGNGALLDLFQGVLVSLCGTFTVFGAFWTSMLPFEWYFENSTNASAISSFRADIFCFLGALAECFYKIAKIYLFVNLSGFLALRLAKFRTVLLIGLLVQPAVVVMACQIMLQPSGMLQFMPSYPQGAIAFLTLVLVLTGASMCLGRALQKRMRKTFLDRQAP